MSVNSARCPLCLDGIGHSMDEEHAAIVLELVKALKKAGNSIGCEGGDIQYIIDALAKAESAASERVQVRAHRPFDSIPTPPNEVI